MEVEPGPRRERNNGCDVAWKRAKQVISWELCNNIINKKKVHVRNTLRDAQHSDVKASRRWRLRKVEVR